MEVNDVKAMYICTPEKDYDQTAMDLRLSRLQVILIAKYLCTHQPALGPRGGLWPVLLICNP
jgi:hypothetical protein